MTRREHVASEAIRFIEESIVDNQQSFFLYLNPTVPHGSGNVRSVLEEGDCTHTVAGKLEDAPSIPYGAPEGYGDTCRTYRQTILDRARRRASDQELGMIWIDDAVGWIMETLVALGELDNTFFLFQQDHGQEGKGSLYEPGVRMFQFIHYPDKISSGTFEGLVSTIDIGPTMLEFAGITASPYEMDGMSWAQAVQDPALEEEWRERCLFFELDYDRSVKCGCHVYMRLENQASGTRSMAANIGYTLNSGLDQIFNVCTGTGDWAYSPAVSQQQDGSSALASEAEKVTELSEMITCHLQKTLPEEDPTFSDCTSPCNDVASFLIYRAQTDSYETRTCDWVERIMSSRCTIYGHYCPYTCGLCQ